MKRENKQIHIRNVIVENKNTIRYSVEYGSNANKFFSGEDFFVEYGEDISQVPQHILVIPLLSNLCPVAWITGADVYVEQLDSGFHESLMIAKQSFAKMYPRIKFTGDIHVSNLMNGSSPSRSSRSATFFSGGVDSMGTFINRKEEYPFFITVWGADIKFNQQEMWQRVRQYNEEFAQSNGIQSLFIKSNLHTFLNEEQISYSYGRFTHGWWPGVQHGIGMVGLVAPLAHLLGIGRLYVPSALPPKLARSFPDGSNTMINNHIRWAGTQVQLDGEEFTRQEKVSSIAEYIGNSDRQVCIRVCWMNKEYGNCCRCEKCYRTIVALLAEGTDPRRAGFDIHPEVFGDIRQRLPHWLPHNVLKIEYWNEIRLRSIQNQSLISPEAREFFDWFQRLDIPSFSKRTNVKKLLLDWIPHPLFLLFKKIGFNRLLKTE
ncbi:hypothetical protein [Cohnella lupini]|uniref:7-cyano-7-deazaguanine synthase in queuosine biosynthesis n=1 Tax=Cohnella lupini TaxID=1294267 RepID=A0A3D9ITQ7_9BACL|nr:hypothetical protein [Cohnella lupini]RED65085.1 hypothetical protein DFP95_102507 [Cohnella lupini]